MDRIACRSSSDTALRRARARCIRVCAAHLGRGCAVRYMWEDRTLFRARRDPRPLENVSARKSRDNRILTSALLTPRSAALFLPPLVITFWSTSAFSILRFILLYICQLVDARLKRYFLYSPLIGVDHNVGLNKNIFFFFVTGLSTP